MSAHSDSVGSAVRLPVPAVSNRARKTKPSSLLQTPVVLEAFLISASFHVVAAAVLGVPSGAPTIPFILLSVSDIALIALACVPLVGMRRSLLAWHDPLVYLGILFLLSTCMFYCAYLYDPSFMVGYVSFLGNNFSGVSESTLLYVFAKATCIEAMYFALILLFNRRVLLPTFVRAGKSDEAYGATFAGVLLMGLGAYGVLKLRATPFFSQVIGNLGRSMATPPTGLARYVMLAGVAASAVSLALVGWLNITAPTRKKLSVWRSVLPGTLIALSVLPSIFFGSRISVILAVFVALAVLRHFGYTLSPRVLTALICVGVVGAFAVTVLRANAGVAESLDARLLSSSSLSTLAGNRDRIAFLALNMDRTANTSLVIRQMETTGHYLWGATLVAGWDAVAYDYASRLGLVSSGYQPLRTSNGYMELWRFGQITNRSTVPPGVPSEFYMNGGYVGVLVFGSGFGWVFAFLRRRMWKSSSLASRWLYVTVLLFVATDSLTQTSLLAAQLGYTIAAIMLAVLLFRLAVRLSTRRQSRTAAAAGVSQ